MIDYEIFQAYTNKHFRIELKNGEIVEGVLEKFDNPYLTIDGSTYHYDDILYYSF